MMLEQLPLHRLANCHNFRQVGWVHETRVEGKTSRWPWLYMKRKKDLWLKGGGFQTSNLNF